MFKKSTAVPSFVIGCFIKTSDGSEVITGTVVCTRVLDGASGSCTNAASYDGTLGAWVISLSVADMSADLVGLKFSLATCQPITFTIKTVTDQFLATPILSSPAYKLATDVNGYVTATRPDGTPIYYELPGNVLCSRADIEDIFGVENVNTWADLNSNQNATEIADRVSRAITVVTADVYDRLRGGAYAIPLQVNDASKASIVTLAATGAGVWLYECRGTVDFDATTGAATHQLHWHRKRYETEIKELRAGSRRIDAVRIGNGTNTPTVGR